MKTGTITFDFNNMFTNAVGIHGIAPEQFTTAAAAVPSLHQAMLDGRQYMSWRQLPYNQTEVVKQIKKAASEINRCFDNFVVLGIGGSSLGSKALFAACCHPRYNELPRKQRGGCRFYVEDNVDPDKLNALFDVIDVKKTAFHIISKSGNTVETMSQFIIVLDRLKHELGADYLRNIYLTTDKNSGLLKQIADQNGLPTFVVPDGVGGRFSVLCPVGLLSAAVLNLDIEALLAGAAAMDAVCTCARLEKNPIYMYALLYTEAMQKGVNISVMMPYCDSLAPLADWYCQLWAESLGKAADRQGNIIHTGQTPVRAVGVTDQHSQLQLYNEGPFDKIISFIGLKNFRTTLSIPSAPLPLGEMNYVCGQTLNKLIECERTATIYAVTQHGKMNNSIILSKLNEYTLGKLFCFFELATAASGELLNINAFDQPGVEAGKKATFAMMGLPGYEDKARELQAASTSGDQLIYLV